MSEAYSLSRDPVQRLEEALDGVVSALGLAVREAEGALGDPGRWRWVALGLVSALGAALVAALSGYDTASPEDVSDPAEPARIAPIALLLRRVRSGDYLNTPERLRMSRAGLRQLSRLLAVRNAGVHGMSFSAPDDSHELVAVARAVLRHLLIDHPAFDPARFPGKTAGIEELIRALEPFSRAGRDG